MRLPKFCALQSQGQGRGADTMAVATVQMIAEPQETSWIAGSRIVDLPVSTVKRSPFQVRAQLDQEHVAALAQSIQDMELSSPILVRPLSIEGQYELVCGENRLEAHKLLGRHVIRAVVRSLSDHEAASILAADNLQRRELSDWEICQTVNMLTSTGAAKTDAQIARILGRPRSFVTKVRAFNDLPPGAAAIIGATPSLFGASLASDLRTSGYCKKHPDLVEEALSRVVGGSLTQAGVISWLRSKTTPATGTALKDTTVTIKNKKVRITVYQDTIRISCKGMNSLDIEASLQTALEKSL